LPILRLSAFWIAGYDGNARRTRLGDSVLSCAPADLAPWHKARDPADPRTFLVAPDSDGADLGALKTAAGLLPLDLVTLAARQRAALSCFGTWADEVRKEPGSIDR
jgi:hypothetical protein